APPTSDRKERRRRGDCARRRPRSGDVERRRQGGSARFADAHAEGRSSGGGRATRELASLMLIGAHISSAGGIDRAIDRAVDLDADSVQVFTQSPRAWRPTNHVPASFERFREKRTEAGIGGVLCHALYLCNLAAPDDAVYEKSVA